MKADPGKLFDLSGEVALVTGASSGLGARFAELLAAYGAKVVLVARREEKLRELAGIIEKDGGEAVCLPCDVTEREKIPELFDAAEKAFGPVTILVNNAGIAVERRVLDMSDEDWSNVLNLNLNAVWYIAHEAARRMAEQKLPGRIINIASILGLAVSRTLSAYAVAKGGVVQLTRAMALELAGRGIRVNAIAPGYILTDINRHFFETDAGEEFIARKIPMKRIGQVEDLDGTLLLLASGASGYMTGSIVTVDGGQLLSGA